MNFWKLIIKYFSMFYSQWYGTESVNCLTTFSIFIILKKNIVRFSDFTNLYLYAGFYMLYLLQKIFCIAGYMLDIICYIFRKKSSGYMLLCSTGGCFAQDNFLLFTVQPNIWRIWNETICWCTFYPWMDLINAGRWYKIIESASRSFVLISISSQMHS